MNDRDDYPDNPYRGRADREGGYDYDPLTDPLAAQPPSRGRRARPGPPDAAGPVGPPHTSTGEFRTPQYAPRPEGHLDPLEPGGPAPTGRRRRAAEPQEEPPRRTGAVPQGDQGRRGGAAEALRGSRAARSAAQRQGGGPVDPQPPAGGSGPLPAPGPAQPTTAQPPGAAAPGARQGQRSAPSDPTQDGLAALAGLGSPTPPAPQAPPASQAPQQPLEGEEHPRRGRRARREPSAPGPADAGPDAGAFVEPEEPVGRRARRKRAKRAPDPDEGGFLSDVPEDDSVFDTGAFPGVHQSADTGAFAAISDPDDPPRRGRRRGRDPEPPEDEPRSRFGRRKRARRTEEPAADADAFMADTHEEPGAFEPEPFESGAFAQAEEPQGRPRRGRGRRRGRADRQAPDEGDATGETPVEAFREEEPGGRRARRARRAEEPVADTGAFTDRAQEPSGPFEPGPFDSGAFEQPEEPSGRRGRVAGVPDEDLTTGEMSVEAPEEEEPVGRRSRRRRRGAAEEPTGRRSRRRRGRRASDGFDVEDPREPLPEPEHEPEAQADEDDDYDYEEPALDDIAAAYGNGRRQREMARRAKQARQRKGGSGKARRKRKSKGLMIALVLVLVLVVMGGGYGVVRTYIFPADFSGEGSGEVVFTIEEGDSGTAVGANLTDAGVVASVRAFTNALDAVPPEEAGEGLVPGTYSLAEGMSGESAVAALLDPDNRLGGRVTIREGLRSEEIFEHLSTELGIPVADLEEAYADADSLDLPEYATAGPEGYLFPETYRFDAGTEAGVVLRTMVTHFRQVAEEIELEDRAAALDRDPNEIMAIASIVQAETGNEEDMPLISAVVHNRLALGMELQMDSTCFYVLGEKGTFLNDEQRSACEADPQGYSTYGMAGLPEGPFVPPGQDAIEAALEPADVNYLYFALIDPENGETGFSETLEEHNQMVAENQAEW
ncbi:endolytic transglycosylase MltG [Nocardiopsis sp. YSL2]|uniref:endolytic transglycosylase MltG n=1 Tax=Nocardiopsis sp. YSL2 TaxID=2939492 RepID=UPI0026F475D8|nr:endolytic transglycosylase MltG [Nocardiopsis sp. YSL2]